MSSQTGITARRYASTANRFLFLLTALVIIIFLYPFVEETDQSGLIYHILMTIILVLALYAVIDRKAYFRLAGILLLPALIMLWARSVFGSTPGVIIGSAFTSVLFLGTIIAIIIHRILTTRNVNRDTIYGAISVYLLIGLLWTRLYAAVTDMVPAAFCYPPEIALPGSSLTFGNLLYFSFITLTTTGYGDITPAISITQSLAMVEAITGVIFIAVFVSRLVGIVGWGESDDEKDKEE